MNEKLAQLYALLLMGAYHDIQQLLDRSGVFATANEVMLTLGNAAESLLNHHPSEAIATLRELMKSQSDATSVDYKLAQRLLDTVRIRTLHDMLTIYKVIKMTFLAEQLGFIIIDSGDDTQAAEAVQEYLESQGVASPRIWSQRLGQDDDMSASSVKKMVPAPFAGSKLLQSAASSSTHTSLLQLADPRSPTTKYDKHIGDDVEDKLHHLTNVVTFMEQRRTNV
jgi:hypothetical protein